METAFLIWLQCGSQLYVFVYFFTTWFLCHESTMECSMLNSAYYMYVDKQGMFVSRLLIMWVSITSEAHGNGRFSLHPNGFVYQHIPIEPEYFICVDDKAGYYRDYRIVMGGSPSPMREQPTPKEMMGIASIWVNLKLNLTAQHFPFCIQLCWPDIYKLIASSRIRLSTVICGITAEGLHCFCNPAAQGKQNTEMSSPRFQTLWL